jgi:hypothetical protein
VWGGGAWWVGGPVVAILGGKFCLLALPELLAPLAHPVRVQQLPRHADSPPTVHGGPLKGSPGLPVEAHSNAPSVACAWGGHAGRVDMVLLLGQGHPEKYHPHILLV